MICASHSLRQMNEVKFLEQKTKMKRHVLIKFANPYLGQAKQLFQLFFFPNKM